MGVQINGLARTIFSVANWEQSAPFYRAMNTFLGPTLRKGLVN